MRYKLVVLLFCCFLGACNALNVKNNLDRLAKNIDAYSAALRWGRVREAAGNHITRTGVQEDVDYEYIEKFSITDFYILEKIVDIDAGTAIVKVEIGYYDEEYGTVNKLKETQIWWLDNENKTWHIESPFPKFQ